MKNIRIFENKQAAVESLADQLCQWSAMPRQDRRGFHIALAGGSTPRALYELLATSPYMDDFDWRDTGFYFGDERCVGRDHQDSNYRMARRALFDHVPVEMSHIFPMAGDAADLDKAAADYERTIRENVPQSGQIPRFDMVLLGMGDDGHTASLFPETTALREQHKLVVPVFVPKLNSWRLSFTYPLINNAARVVMLVTGAAKAGIVAEVISGGGEQRYPVQAVQPVGEFYWYLDQEAAARLE